MLTHLQQAVCIHPTTQKNAWLSSMHDTPLSSHCFHLPSIRARTRSPATRPGHLCFSSMHYTPLRAVPLTPILEQCVYTSPAINMRPVFRVFIVSCVPYPLSSCTSWGMRQLHQTFQIGRPLLFQCQFILTEQARSVSLQDVKSATSTCKSNA